MMGAALHQLHAAADPAGAADADHADAAAHYAAQARKPTNPAHMRRWLATVPVNRLLPEAQALADELALIHGFGHTPQRGCHFANCTFGGEDVLVEYEYEAGEEAHLSGPPEDCSPGYAESITPLQMLFNGAWCDLDDVALSTVERWCEQIAQQRQDEADAAMESRAESEREFA